MFSKVRFLLFLLLFLCWGAAAQGINLASIYYSACKRDIGVIVKVDDSNIQFITLEGKIKRVPRFDIIYLAYYPVGFTPIGEISDPGGLEVISIQTVHQHEIVALVRGWMIDSSEEQISFLTVNGFDTVINISDIWELTIEPLQKPIVFKNELDFAYRFHHPYPFAHCPQEQPVGQAAHARVNTVFPQYLLGDPLLIKKELDRLEQGHERIKGYFRNKSYYSIPQIYRNDTELGFWVNGGSRYGASGNRPNSFIPEVRSGLSEGPFAFQRVVVTGAAPMPYSVQEEVQTQFYYRLKSDYLHFSIMYDIGRMVVGEGKYKWQPKDLADQDDRLNDIFHVGGGFDTGGFSFNYTLTEVQYAASYGSLFIFDRATLHKLGVSYQNRLFKLDFFRANGGDQKPGVLELLEGDTPQDYEDAQAAAAAIPDFFADFRVTRVNLHLEPREKMGLMVSLIYRTFDFRRSPDLEGAGQFQYASTSLTNAVYLNFPLGLDIHLSLYLALEAHANRFGETDWSGRASHTFPKGGVGITLKI